MRRLTLLLALPVLLPLQTTLRVDVNLVSVFATVQDEFGNFVTDLKQDDFLVFEDGRQLPIEIFEKRDDLRTSVGVLIDNSGSSADVLGSVRKGVEEFASGLSPRDETFIMSFAIEADVVHSFYQDRRQIPGVLARLRSWGTSVFYDAMYSGISTVAGGANERKALIVLSDGKDNRSETSYTAVVQSAQSNMALLYFVAMGAPILIDLHTIEGLASMTGGSVILVGRDEPVAGALRKINNELRNQYYLGYHASPDKGYHSIRIEVPGRNLQIRAREGYLVQ
jgi:Ca-activated chloride channel family protein